MKKAYCIFLALILLAGCAEENKILDQNTSAGVDPNATLVAEGKSSPQESELLSDKGPDLDDPKVLESILDEAVVGDEVKTGWRRVNDANGKVSSLSQFRDGRPDGLQFGWHENGQTRIRVRIKDRKPDGLWTAWDENGSKIHELPYIGNYSPFEGKMFRWHENGKKAYQATYEKDRLIEASWHENGQQSSEKNYRNFQRDGTWTEWNQTGEIVSHEKWKDGRRWDGQWTLMPGDGEDEKRCEIIMKDGSGTRIYYRKNGTVFHRTTFEAGREVERIFPPSTPLDAKDFEGDVAKVLETMSEEDRKNIAVLPEEIRTGLLQGVKDSFFLKREPKRFDGAREELKRNIGRLWDRLKFDMRQREDHDRSILRTESYRIQGESEQTLSSSALSIYAFQDEITKGQSLKEHREPASVKILQAKESGATKLILKKLYPDSTLDLKPLAECIKLSSFHLSGYQVTDLTPLAKLTNLSILSIQGNPVTDISPLAGLTNLTDLSLVSNDVSDLGPLAKLSNLSALTIVANQVTDLTPLAGLTNLTKITLGMNNISDITPLTELTNLIELDLQANPIPSDQKAMLRKALPNCEILF
jgi:antitoxin component YwqK of YwqJK toxin-antitoxin module